MGRILVIRGGAVGDFILTLPAIRLLKDHLPDNELEILGYPSIISLAEAAGIAHRTRSIEHGALSGFFIPDAVLDPDWMDYFSSFDLIVSYLYDPDDRFHSNLKKCDPGSVLSCSHRVAEPGDHAAIQLARPLEKLALFLEDHAPSLTFEQTARAAKNGGREESTGKTIAIHPGSGGRHKIWPTENWITAARSLAESRPSDRIVIITGEAELERGITSEITGGLDGIAFEHFDCLPLPDLAARLSGCDLFLGHDSGISHLAAACGTPCVLLFGPTDSAIWAPQNHGVTVIHAPDGNLKSIRPETVLTAADTALG